MNLFSIRLDRGALNYGLAAALIGATASPASAQWTVVNLQPAGTIGSVAYGVGSGQQVGYAQLGPTVGDYRASLWSASAASWLNLHPAGADWSLAYGADGGQQVGAAVVAGQYHASLWSGTAASWVDLNPAGQSASTAYGISGSQQAGNTSLGGFNAALWSGTPASWVNLNPPPDV